jgi:dethiobiotin synthetase
MSASTLFVTGTDTGVGKTLVACALLRGLRASGARAVGYKPVASGCESTPNGLRNDDALALQAAGSPGYGYAQINPYAFAPPIAPHLAAEQANRPIDTTVLDAAHARLVASSDWVIVEGAGGWHVPLGRDTDFAGWVAERGWPVLLVVGMRLGCINHAILSANAIAERSPLVGWIANTLDAGQACPADNIACLENRLPAPLRAHVPNHPPPDFRLDPRGW